MIHRATASILPLCIATLTGQSVLHVGPGQPFADIQSAINAAQPGDVVLVAAGTYPAFNLSQSVILRADPVGASVEAANLSTTPGVSGVIEGITFWSHYIFTPINVLQTTLSMSNCSLTNELVLTNASVNLSNCFVNGHNFFISDSVEVHGNSVLTATQTAFSNWTSIGTTNAISVCDSSFLHLNSCQITTFSSGSFASGACLYMSTSGSAILSDCTLITTYYGLGSIQGLASSQIVVDRTTMSPPSAIPLQNRPLVSISTMSSLQRGVTFSVIVRTLPGGLAGMSLNTSITGPTPSGLLAEFDWGIVLAAPVVSLGFADNAGQFLSTIQVPNNPGLLHQPAWFCGWGVTSSNLVPIELSVPALAIVQ
jgi:hypothetical protein